MNKIRTFILAVTSKLDWLPGLLARFTIGLIFVPTGWGKLHHLPQVIEYFQSLGIPAPQLQAPFVASVELVCGTLVLIGLFTRVAAAPLIGTMVVAIWTAKLPDVKDLSDFLSLSEYLFIILLIVLIIKGAGAVSVDYVLSKRAPSSTQ